MIFLPGFMDNGLCYDRVAEEFADEHDLYLVDARGHGQSSDPPPNATYLDLIEDIYDLCIAKQLKDVILVGHSMGGVEAALFAAEHPELVEAVVLEDPGFAPKLNRFVASLIAFFFSLIFSHQDNPAPLPQQEIRAKKINSKWAERDQMVWAKAQLEFRKHYPKEDLKILLTGAPADKILPRILAPILLVTSEHGITKQKKAHLYQTMAKDLHWQYVPNAGHNIRREQFELYVDAIKRFFHEIGV